ncbi:unnamed protein product [Amoebophrya sp. A25]|nr:unnamed protein product [Amoebophrya sp. A25]|eukprot:GSA25T00011261001.1
MLRRDVGTPLLIPRPSPMLAGRAPLLSLPPAAVISVKKTASGGAVANGITPSSSSSNPVTAQSSLVSSLGNFSTPSSIRVLALKPVGIGEVASTRSSASNAASLGSAALRSSLPWAEESAAEGGSDRVDGDGKQASPSAPAAPAVLQRNFLHQIRSKAVDAVKKSKSPVDAIPQFQFLALGSLKLSSGQSLSKGRRVLDRLPWEPLQPAASAKPKDLGEGKNQDGDEAQEEASPDAEKAANKDPGEAENAEAAAETAAAQPADGDNRSFLYDKSAPTDEKGDLAVKKGDQGEHPQPQSPPPFAFYQESEEPCGFLLVVAGSKTSASSSSDKAPVNIDISDEAGVPEDGETEEAAIELMGKHPYVKDEELEFLRRYFCWDPTEMERLLQDQCRYRGNEVYVHQHAPGMGMRKSVGLRWRVDSSAHEEVHISWPYDMLLQDRPEESPAMFY